MIASSAVVVSANTTRSAPPDSAAAARSVTANAGFPSAAATIRASRSIDSLGSKASKDRFGVCVRRSLQQGATGKGRGGAASRSAGPS